MPPVVPAAVMKSEQPGIVVPVLPVLVSLYQRQLLGCCFLCVSRRRTPVKESSVGAIPGVADLS